MFMKRFFILFLVMLAMLPVTSFAENQTVVQMPYTVEMPDVTRGGLYTGAVLNGMPHGYGVFAAVNSSGTPWHYLGQWVDGKMCGRGGQYWDNGYFRVGTYKNNDMVSGEEYSGVNVPMGEYYVGSDIPSGTYTVRTTSLIAMFTIYKANGDLDNMYSVSPDSHIGKITLSDGQIVKLSGNMYFSPYAGLGFN